MIAEFEMQTAERLRASAALMTPISAADAPLRPGRPSSHPLSHHLQEEPHPSYSALSSEVDATRWPPPPDLFSDLSDLFAHSSAQRTPLLCGSFGDPPRPLLYASPPTAPYSAGSPVALTAFKSNATAPTTRRSSGAGSIASVGVAPALSSTSALRTRARRQTAAAGGAGAAAAGGAGAAVAGGAGAAAAGGAGAAAAASKKTAQAPPEPHQDWQVDLGASMNSEQVEEGRVEGSAQSFPNPTGGSLPASGGSNHIVITL